MEAVIKFAMRKKTRGECLNSSVNFVTIDTQTETVEPDSSFTALLIGFGTMNLYEFA